MTSSSWLASDGDPDENADTGILKEVLPLSDRRNWANFATNIYDFLEVGCLTGNKPFDCEADLDPDPDPGIFNGIFTIVG